MMERIASAAKGPSTAETTTKDGESALRPGPKRTLTPQTQVAQTEERGPVPSPEHLAELLARGTLRKLYAIQTPAWREYVANVCHGFLDKTVEGKTEVAWNLLLGVKRFLFYPEDKLSQRQLARELRMRAHLEARIRSCAIHEIY